MSDTPYYYTYYAGIVCFFVSSCTSDLLIIRLSLMNGFGLLALSIGFYYEDAPSITWEDTIIPILLYIVLFLWNFIICIRLLDDSIRPKLQQLLQHQRRRRGAKSKSNDCNVDNYDHALYKFFQRRCGLTRLEFDEIRRHGKYVELPANTEVPNVDTTLYLVLEGLVECETRERSGYNHKSSSSSRNNICMFPKRSGQFFDLKFFNLFALPVGFDSLHFKATTASGRGHAGNKTTTRLFGWSVKSLIAMRDSKTFPSLRGFWEYMILRSLAHDSIRHHLQAAAEAQQGVSQEDNGGMNWVLPENPEWYDGGLSYEFENSEVATITTTKCCSGFNDLLSQFHFLPTKGIRNKPPSCDYLLAGGQQQRQHHSRQRQQCIEIVAKAKQECMENMEGEEGSWQNVLFMSTFGGCFYNNNQHDISASDSSHSSHNHNQPNELMEYHYKSNSRNSNTNTNERNTYQSSLNRIMEQQEDEQPTNGVHYAPKSTDNNRSRNTTTTTNSGSVVVVEGPTRNQQHQQSYKQHLQQFHSSKREYKGNVYSSLIKDEEESSQDHEHNQQDAATPRITNHYISSSVNHTRVQQQQQQPIHNNNNNNSSVIGDSFNQGESSFQQQLLQQASSGTATSTSTSTGTSTSAGDGSGIYSNTGLGGVQSSESYQSCSGTGATTTTASPAAAGAYPTSNMSSSWNTTQPQSSSSTRPILAWEAAAAAAAAETPSATPVKTNNSNKEIHFHPEQHQQQQEMGSKEETKTEIQPPPPPSSEEAEEELGLVVESSDSVMQYFEAVWKEDTTSTSV